jgi:16S rRNA (guanine966-N2)-methyltransferase
MKDRTREAVMNLLGGTLEDHLAFDLFGGSGVMAFESLSRGAKHACVWEVLKTGAETIRGFAKELGLSDRLTVLHEDVLRWSKNLAENLKGLQLEPAGAWVVFCCPPYSMWEEHGAEIRSAMEGWIALAPVGSLFAIELEVGTSEEWLPPRIDWDLRRYTPAKMAIGQKTGP